VSAERLTRGEETPTMATSILNVPDISCGHCQATITTALEPLDGVTDVNVDIPTKKVTVRYDEAVIGLDRMKGVLAEEGYPVESVEQPRRAGSGTSGVPTVAVGTNGGDIAMATATTTTDPVCGMAVDPTTARQTSEYRGTTFSFCSPRCKEAFDADPAGYVGESEDEASSRTSGGCACCVAPA